MKWIQHWLRARNQYSLQSPFVFELYTRVIAPRLDKATLHQLNISKRDNYGQLRYKLIDYYQLRPLASTRSNAPEQWAMNDGSKVSLVRSPHKNAESERTWRQYCNADGVTLSVDLFVAGLLFDSPKLSKQHLILSYHSTFPNMGTKLQLP